MKIKIFLFLFISFLFLLNQVSCRAETTTTVSEPEQTLKTPNAYIISQLKVPGQAIDVKVSGNYAYLTNDLGILYVIDVSDKGRPKLAGSCKIEGEPNGIFVQGNYAYINNSYLDYQTKQYTQESKL